MSRPDAPGGDLTAFMRDHGTLEPRDASEGITSPRLGLTLAADGDQLAVHWEYGTAFRSFEQLDVALGEAEAQLAAERQRAEAERQRAEAERRRAEALLARLRAAGLDGP